MTAPGNPHTFHQCDDDACVICKQDLSFCEVCCGCNGSLLTHCPGYALSKEARVAISPGGNVYDLHMYRMHRLKQRRKAPWARRGYAKSVS